ncbi:MAG: site-2 protease family protein [Candidatus Aceula meridiana]|nr:site-2 protease family protein [Candidatus Aceula meridiana]
MPVYLFLKIALIFFPSVICHEYAHGWVAYRLGDPTAKNQGRLTLNPFKHVDPIGTIAFPMMLFFLRSPFIFGWAKPVPVNFARLKNPKRDMILVGAAGPATNLFLAVFLSRFLVFSLSEGSLYVLQMGVIINLALAFFNLIPIPPLDGSRIVMGILPHRAAYTYAKLEKYGIIIVFLLLYLGLLKHTIWPLVAIVASFLGVQL